MTKEELIAKMAASAGITKVAAGNALHAFTGAVTSSLKRGQRVSLVNFGTFTISKRKARMGRNPRTGESLKIPAAKVPKFSAGKVLKSAVRYSAGAETRSRPDRKKREGSVLTCGHA